MPLSQTRRNRSTIARLRREIEALRHLHNIEANKGGTFILLRADEKNKCTLEVGQDCVNMVDGVYDVEHIATILIKALSKRK